MKSPSSSRLITLGEHPLVRARPGGPGSVNFRTILVLKMLFEHGPLPTTQIRAGMPPFKSDGAFNSMMTRIQKEDLVEGRSGNPRRPGRGGSAPFTLWLTEHGLKLFETCREWMSECCRAVRNRFYDDFASSRAEEARKTPLLAAPGSPDAKLRPPTPREFRDILSGPDVGPEFKLLCEALRAWPGDAKDLVAWRLRDAWIVDSDQARVPLQAAGTVTDQVKDALEAAIVAAVQLRKAGLVFASRYGAFWNRKLFERDRKEARSKQYLRLARALECNSRCLGFKQLTTLRIADVDLKGGRVWVLGNERERVSREPNDRLLTILKEAFDLTLTKPLFLNPRGAEWGLLDMPHRFRRLARNKGVPDNVRFPGSAKFRAPLVLECGHSGRRDRVETASPELVLFERDRAPEIGGVPQSFLSTPREKVVRALLSAGPRGLTKDQLVETSGCGDARKILARLKDLSKAWASVIELPGRPGGGYRIRGHLAKNGHPH